MKARTHIEKTLQESEKYRTMVENSANIIGIFQDEVLKYVNSAAVLKLGWTYEELLSPSFDPIEKVVAPKSRKLLKENVSKRLRGEDVPSYEITLIRKDGSEVQVLIRGTKIIYNQKPAIEFVFDDITERKRAEEQLRQSEERYRSLIDRMLDGIYLSTHEGRFVEVNSAFVKMFGYSNKQEMLDIKDIKKELYFSPEERGRHILDTDQEEVKQYRMRRKDGSEVWVEDHGGYVHDEQGNIVYHEGMLRDITERRRAEEAVRESEEKYRTIFHNSPLGIFRSTFDGHLLEVNPALAKMFGYGSPENMVHEVYDVAKQVFVRAEDRNTIVNQQLGSNDVTQHLNHYRRKDGSEFIANLYVKTVRDGQGQPIFLEGIVEDITERKRLEEELERYSLHLEELVAERTVKLRESEEKYRELFDACPVSFWEEDFSAVKQFIDELRRKGVSDFGAYFANHPEDIAKCAGLVKVLRVNKATVSLYDAKSADEILGGLSGLLTEESNRKRFVGELLALAQGKKYYEAEMENRTLRGETKHCNVICAVVPGYEQSLARVLICIVDLTTQKKLEADLIKSQRLAAIGETAAKVGHDLRNPLQGIAGALYLLRKESLTAEERNEMLQVIENDLKYSDAIIKDLSDYSAEINLKLTPTTPKLIARDGIQAVKVPLNVRVEDLSEDQPSLGVDPDRMRRVFINLIQNAIDAMPQGGTLTISSKQFKDDAEITISDTGSGMSQKIMENLWKPFQTTKAKGMGLGLAICKRIVDAHEGNISVKSKAGEGTTMTIRLPIKLEQVEVKQR